MAYQQRLGVDIHADVVIVGGGPAGLSAALLLARARRTVLIFDFGKKRNEAVHEMHAVLGADGFPRSTYLQQAREQVLGYPTVQFHALEVTRVDIIPHDGTCDGDRSSVLSTSPSSSSAESSHPGSPMSCSRTECFEVTTADASRWTGRKLVLATGMKDAIPEVEGFKELFGNGIFVCLYCEGYECRDEPLATYGNGERGTHIALEMLQLSRDVTLLSDGPLEATEAEQGLLERNGIRVVPTKVACAFSRPDRQLGGMRLQDGQEIPLRAIFFNTGRYQCSVLPTRMGLELDERGDILCDTASGRVPRIHGLFVAGNNSLAPLQLIMTAASQGAIVAKCINSELMYEDLGLTDGGQYLDGERTCVRESGNVCSTSAEE